MDPALTAAAIGVGGTVILGIAGFWANVRNTNKITKVTEQGQLTDRYSKAVEQLGSDMLDVRIGGIYALERIARDSHRDHPTIMEVLAAFVREHSKVPSEEGTSHPDVQAAFIVIGRNPQLDRQQLDLHGADLSGAYLPGVRLSMADLRDANLMLATLGRADLSGANLILADLSGAYLTGAYLDGANLLLANLDGANLTGARLDDANLDSTLWPTDEAVPRGWQLMDLGRLRRLPTTSAGD